MDETVRVAMFSHFFETGGGGIEVVAEGLARNLNALGFSVRWIACDNTSDKADKNNVVPLSYSGVLASLLKIPYPVLGINSWRRVYDEVKNTDLVIAHDSLYQTTVAAFFAARRFRKPFVLIQHIGFVPYRSTVLRALMHTANRYIGQPLLRRASTVVFISETTQTYFSRVRWKKKPKLIFNGIDTAVFTRGSGSTDVLRQQLGLPVRPPLVLFVGRFVEKKGIAVLEQVARRAPELTFAFAGQGPLDPRAWKLSNVHVISHLSRDALANLYQASDALLLPSVGEGYPLVVQEALCCGLPVICGSDTAQADPAAQSLLHAIQVDLTNLQVTADRLLASLPDALRVGAIPSERDRRSAFATKRYSWSSVSLLYAAILREARVLA